jgi:hypothetical protein
VVTEDKRLALTFTPNLACPSSASLFGTTPTHSYSSTTTPWWASTRRSFFQSTSTHITVQQRCAPLLLALPSHICYCPPSYVSIIASTYLAIVDTLSDSNQSILPRHSTTLPTHTRCPPTLYLPSPTARPSLFPPAPSSSSGSTPPRSRPAVYTTRRCLSSSGPTYLRS